MSKKLLVFDAAYSLKMIRERGIEHSFTSRNPDGLFEHVWNIHPLVGADELSHGEDVGPLRTAALNTNHTFVEAPVGRFRWLRKLPVLNFIVSQVLLFAYLLRLIRREKVSAVLAGDPYYQGLFGLVLARLNRIPFAVRINGNYDAIFAAIGQLAYPRLIRNRRIEKLMDRFVLPRADMVAAANEDSLGFALDNGARSERATVFRYGRLIDPLHYEDPRTRPSVRHEVSLQERPFIACIGRLEPVKHPADAIRALVVAHEDHPTLGLVMVGDGSMRDELEKLAGTLGVAGDVAFVGNRSQSWIANCLTEAVAVAAPMAGRALVEAMLSATPIVAYDVDWHDELIEHEVNGLLVPFGDWEGMGKALTSVIHAPEMGNLGREVALRKMDQAKLAAHERRCYERFLLREPM